MRTITKPRRTRARIQCPRTRLGGTCTSVGVQITVDRSTKIRCLSDRLRGILCECVCVREYVRVLARSYVLPCSCDDGESVFAFRRLHGNHGATGSGGRIRVVHSTSVWHWSDFLFRNRARSYTHAHKRTFKHTHTHTRGAHARTHAATGNVCAACVRVCNRIRLR